MKQNRIDVGSEPNCHERKGELNKGRQECRRIILPIFVSPNNDTRQTVKTPLAIEKVIAFSSGQIEEKGWEINFVLRIITSTKANCEIEGTVYVVLIGILRFIPLLVIIIKINFHTQVGINA